MYGLLMTTLCYAIAVAFSIIAGSAGLGYLFGTVRRTVIGPVGSLRECAMCRFRTFTVTKERPDQTNCHRCQPVVAI